MSLQPAMPLFSMFRPSAAPDADALRAGAQAAALGKMPVDVSSYHAEVFDMMDRDGRDRYCRTMMDLVGKVQSGGTVIWRNDFCALTMGDGSSRWHRYLEWSDYSVRGDGVSGASGGSGDVG